MSQASPNPPPLPPLGAPNPYLPPLRVEPLSYSTATRGRPGILTAVGIISIVLGGISLLSNGGSALSMLLLRQAAPRVARVTGASGTVLSATARPAMPGGSSPAAPGVTASSSSVDPRGYAPAERSAVIAGLTANHPLSRQRIVMLDRLLAKNGQDMFLLWGKSLNADAVAKNVSASGRLPGVRGKLGNDYFIVGLGRIELADDHAVFSPSGVGESVRVYESDDEQPQPGASGRGSTPPPLVFPTMPWPSAGSMLAEGIDLSVCALLALFLLACGILVLRDSPQGQKLHLVYAWIKIPLAVIGGAIYGWYIGDMMFGAAPAGGSPFAGAARGIVIGMALMQMVLACIYPIALLIVMHTRAVKGYYNPVLE